MRFARADSRSDHVARTKATTRRKRERYPYSQSKQIGNALVPVASSYTFGVSAAALSASVQADATDRVKMGSDTTYRLDANPMLPIMTQLAGIVRALATAGAIPSGLGSVLFGVKNATVVLANPGMQRLRRNDTGFPRPRERRWRSKI